MKTKKRVLMVIILISSTLLVTQAFAQTTLLSLIHESEDGENNFWWKGSTPAFTDLDKELASSFRPYSVKLIQPSKSVSRVYRTHELGDEKAQTIASLFGAQIVMYGKLELTTLEAVVGQKGVQARMRVSLVGRRGTDTQTFSAVVYGNDPLLARVQAKRVVTKQLARFVNWASSEKTSDDVGYPLSSMEIFLENGNGELISKLGEQFALNKGKIMPIWASESGIAFRVSGVNLNAIRRIVERVESEDIEIEIAKKDQGLVVRGKK